MILEKIDGPADLKKIRGWQLPQLAEEIRQLIIEVVSRNGGHLSSNLGVVELTISLHRLLDWEKDTLIWDVGHQTYAHKILTGRRAAFPSLRTYGGLSGFPEPSESPTDPFRTGHASTSIAIGLGIATGQKEGRVVVVIGDASLGGGVAFEALNQAGAAKTNLCVISNANEMAISPTTGGLALSFTRLITNPYLESFRQHTRTLLERVPFVGPETATLFQKTEEGLKNLFGPAALFESLGFRYFGPFDGHNLQQLEEALGTIINLPGPKLVHVVTRKGKGYPPAEADPERFHSAVPFVVATGKELEPSPFTYRDVFAAALVEEAKRRPEVVAITAAMAKGTGLSAFQRAFPERFFDAGIAEQDAVAFAAGLAKAGKHPVVAIYATFFQRSWDQLFQEACLQKLPITFVLPNSGLVGADGPTHHSLFAYSFLRCLPNLTLWAPYSYQELRRCLDAALSNNQPTVILFPKDSGPEDLVAIREEKPDLVVLGIGSLASEAKEATERLHREGVKAAFWPTAGLKPLDETMIRKAAQARLVATVEENSYLGGFGSAFLEYWAQKRISTPVRLIAAPDRFLTFGTRIQLLAEIGLDAAGIYRQLKEFINEDNAENRSNL